MHAVPRADDETLEIPAVQGAQTARGASRSTGSHASDGINVGSGNLHSDGDLHVGAPVSWAGGEPAGLDVFGGVIAALEQNSRTRSDGRSGIGKSIGSARNISAGTVNGDVHVGLPW